MRLIDADALKKEYLDEFWKAIRDDMSGSFDAIGTMTKIIDNAPTVERPHGNWEYLKEHITEMRDADGELNQTKTCQFILNLMGVIEREGDEK